MNEEQKTQYVAFIANLVKLLAKEKMPLAQAEQAAIAAASCLFAVVFDMEPSDGNMVVEDFSVPVIRAAINSFYGMQADPAMLN